MSITSSMKKTARHPNARRAAWALGALGATAAVVAGIVYLDESSAKATPKPTPTPPAPSGQVPVWSQLTPVANPQIPGTFMVNIPASATFAFADAANDPALPAILAGLTAAVQNGTVAASQYSQAGNVAPTGWPDDSFGTNGYRVSGVANSTFSLVLGALSGTVPTSPPSVWIVTGFTSA